MHCIDAFRDRTARRAEALAYGRLASMGTVTAKDPIRFGDGWNLYSYVHNDPLNYFDHTGRQTTPVMPPLPGQQGGPQPTPPATPSTETEREHRMRLCEEDPGFAQLAGIDCNNIDLFEEEGEVEGCHMSCIFGPPLMSNPNYQPGECWSSPECGPMSFDEIKWECVIEPNYSN